MKLSLGAIELCKAKLGKEVLLGFENAGEFQGRSLSQEEAGRVFDELSENELLDVSEEEVHINALGQFVVNMMSAPEQFVMLSNEADGICVRCYLRDARYLCIIEDKGASEDAGYDCYILKLLPRLDLAVSSFAYALYHEEESESGQEKSQKFRVVGKSWDKEQILYSELTVSGEYCTDGVQCSVTETVRDEDPADDVETDLSEVINRVTCWLFRQIAINQKCEEV